MEFDNSFEVPLPPAEAWKVLLDIKRVAPCMPGAELTEVLDQNSYKGKIGVRLGPVALTFAGVVKFEQIDAATHTARVAAQGADATSVFRLEPAGGGSKVLVHTDLALSGAVAQYGRGVGIIQATAAQIMNQFAARLKDKLAQDAAAAVSAPASAAPPPARPSPPAGAAEGPAPTAKPIAGFGLIGKVIWSWIAGLLRRP